MQDNMPPIKSILTACSLLASFAGGYWLADNGWQKKASKERAEAATYIAQLSEQHRKKEHELAKNAKELDQKYTRDLSMAERRIDSLESSLADKSKRLRVKATCPSAMPSSGTTSRLGDAGAPELDESSRQDYLRLKRGLEVQEVQVRYLQEYIKEQCLRGE